MTEQTTIEEQLDIKLLNILEGHNATVNSISFNNSGVSLVSVSRDRTIKGWGAVSGSILKNFECPSSSSFIKKICFVPNNPKLIGFIGWNNTFKILESDTFKIINEINLDQLFMPLTFDYTSDGKFIAIAFSNNKIKIINENKFLPFELNGPDGEILTVSYSRNGKFLSAAGTDKNIRLWNTNITDSFKLLKGHEGPVTCTLFSPDNKILFSSSHDNTVRLWDVNSGKEFLCLKGHTGYVNYIAISSDGKYLISAGHDLTVRVWDLITYKEIKTLTGHISPVYSVAFHPNNLHFASGSSDKTIRIWKIIEKKSIIPHQNKIIFSSNNDTTILEPKNLNYNELAGNTLINSYPEKEIINNNVQLKENNFIATEYSSNDIFKLLNFKPSNLFKNTEQFITLETKKNIEKAILKFEKVIEDNENIGTKQPDNIADSYRSFFSSINKGLHDLIIEFNSVRKARRLAWALFYKDKEKLSIFESEHFPHALKLIDEFWRFTMFFGIFESFLNNPNSNSKNNLYILIKFLSSKIKSYDGKLQNLLKIKKYEKFYFNENGAFLLGSSLISSKKNLSKVLSILELPEHMIGYQYFSDVAVSYTQTAIRDPNFEGLISDILEFLKKHQQSITNKRCIAKLIIKVNQMNNSELQEQIKEFAFINIGDPSIDSFWAPWKGATSVDINELKNVQTILNEWITEQFIELFFEKLAMDRNRKVFWRKYLKDISTFKIFGSEALYESFEDDKRIKPYLKTRFGFMRNTSESALSMVIKDYILVEFSKTGNAFYGYKKSNPSCPDISKTKLRISELKQPNLSDIRIVHIGGWQGKLSSWLIENLSVRR